MAVAKICDRCGAVYQRSREATYQMPDENGDMVFVNSFRIGNWSPKSKSWLNIASAYDLCTDCAKEICDVIFAKGEIKMRKSKAVLEREAQRHKRVSEQGAIDIPQDAMAKLDKEQAEEAERLGEVVAVADPEDVNEENKKEANEDADIIISE